ncbi:MAG: hypothetical protein ACLRTQ_01880 [Candidatus Borkfalkia sp.]
MQNMRGKRLSGEYQKAVYEIISTKLKYKTSEIKARRDQRTFRPI